MNINQILMTPAHAQMLLTKNFNNRRIKVALVAKLKNDILNDNWHLTHQAIAVDVNGNVIDGQHRLTAIVSAQKSVPVMLAVDCDPESMIAVDTGAVRSAGDVLTLEGIKNASIKAAVIRIYLSYYNYPNAWWAGKNVFSIQTIRDELLGCPDIDDHINFCRKCTHQFNLLTTSSLVAFKILALDRDYSPEVIDEFLNRLADGVNQFPGDPIFAYRQYLVNNIKSRYMHSRKTQQSLADLIKLFQAYVYKRKITKFHKLNIPPMPNF